MKNIQNNVQLVGRLGANPEVKVLSNSSKLARFSIAINNNYTNKQGEKVTETQWHSVTAWGKLADLAEKLLQKGTQVAVDGRLSIRKYTSNEGAKVTATEVIANEFYKMESKVAA